MRVLIFGLGLNEGGVGSARFFAKKGDSVRVTDLKSDADLKPSLDALSDFTNIEYTLGEHKFEDIDWADLIIKNPAVKPENPYIEHALKNGKKVETDMGIFLEYVKPSQIIGVTGTKGKSTVASLIYEVLSKHQADTPGVESKVKSGSHTGSELLLAGNIGKSVLDTVEHIKPDTLVILEISSFQLEAFGEKRLSPKWAVITNIYPDHLNYYENMEEYMQSKKLIAKHQSKDDFLFIRKNDPVVDTRKFLGGIKSRIVRFSSNDLSENFKPTLQGKHNLENIAAALAVTKVFDIPEDETLKTLSNFKGVEFRMQLVYDKDGIKIYNDTTATTPEASIQSLETLHNLRSHMESGNSDRRIVLITGGMNKNLNYTKYTTAVSNFVKELFFLEGDATDLIISSLRKTTSHLRGEHEVTPDHTLTIHGPYNNLSHVLKNVRSIVKKGDVVLFSPAATSFNLFQNEFERGRKFNEAVGKIFNG